MTATVIHPTPHPSCARAIVTAWWFVALAAAAFPTGAEPPSAMNQTYDSASYTNRYQPERTIYQDDGRIFHRAGFTYAVVVQTHRSPLRGRRFLGHREALGRHRRRSCA